ncbi:MAG: hypothetical protein WHV64_17315, partial [Geminicoccaceae bacterium]
MAVPVASSAAPPLPSFGDPPLRFGERAPSDPAVRSVVASLADAVEGEVVTLTRRLGACQASARDAARALQEGLAVLAGQEERQDDHGQHDGEQHPR